MCLLPMYGKFTIRYCGLLSPRAIKEETMREQRGGNAGLLNSLTIFQSLERWRGYVVFSVLSDGDTGIFGLESLITNQHQETQRSYRQVSVAQFVYLLLITFIDIHLR